MSAFVFKTSHEIYFSNHEPVPVGEIATTLLALEGIIKRLPKVLEGLTQIEINGVEVFVETIESGSLTEKIFIKLFFKDEDELDAFLDKIGEKLRKPGMPRNLLITAVIASLVGYGAWLAAKVGNPTGTTTITANNNTIINLGAGQVDLTPEAFRAIVASAVQDKKELANNTVKFFKPARADEQASVTIDGNSDTSFSPAVISAVPRAVKFDTQAKSEDLLDVDLEIRATDLDSTKTGWAALIPGKVDRRVKLKLDPRVKPSDVNRFKLRADVSIFYRLDKTQNQLVPDYILLRQVIK